MLFLNYYQGIVNVKLENLRYLCRVVSYYQTKNIHNQFKKDLKLLNEIKFYTDNKLKTFIERYLIRYKLYLKLYLINLLIKVLPSIFVVL